MQASQLTCAILTAFVWIACFLEQSHGASLQTFAVVYGQVTNDLALIQTSFDGSAAQKQKFAALSRAQSVILNPTLTDEQALSTLVDILSPISGYDQLLDISANAARSSLLSRYDALSQRVSLLAPSPRTARARKSYNELAGKIADLKAAEHAPGIASQLAPLGRNLTATSIFVDRAAVMPRPNVGLNSVRATVNGKRFTSGPSGNHSANTFEVTRENQFYNVSCRVVDTSQVLAFTLPVVTSFPRYEVASGMVTATYTPDVFAPSVSTVTATNGTFWIQVVKDELYGLFSCSGPGLDVKDGRFRVQLPKESQ